jgi:glutamate racemase
LLLIIFLAVNELDESLMIENLQSQRIRPIGVFDSGVGGLTVLRALRSHMPTEHYLYLGDTARLPYGSKSPETIQRYSLQAAEFLVNRGIKCLVVACNTASATALPLLQQRFDSIPVIGVVEPGATAGCAASSTGRIGVIATESTVQGGAYQRAIHRLRRDASVIAHACPLFVALAEEGWTSGPIVESIAHRYLEMMFSVADAPDTLLLGCTHFPVLREALQKVVGPQVHLVDSAETTATALKALLQSRQLVNDTSSSGSAAFMATDGRERFARVAAHFLDQALSGGEVELIEPTFAIK